MAEIEVLKLLLGVTGGGLAIFVGWWLIREFFKVIAEKDKVFTAALATFTADMRTTMSELKGAIEQTGKTIIEVDRSHTSNTKEAFQHVIALTGQLSGTMNNITHKVEHLDETVGRLDETVTDQGAKIAALTRSLAAPQSPAVPGGPPGGDFRPPGA